MDWKNNEQQRRNYAMQNERKKTRTEYLTHDFYDNVTLSLWKMFIKYHFMDEF